jgi:hypothetical protein
MLFLKSLILTILIEMSVLIIFIRFVIKKKEISLPRLLFTGFIASFATLPYLWYIFPTYIDQKGWYIIVSESFAVLIESFIILAILRISYLKAFLCSIACNMISFVIGLHINWP